MVEYQKGLLSRNDYVFFARNVIIATCPIVECIKMSILTSCQFVHPIGNGMACFDYLEGEKAAKVRKLVAALPKK